MKFQCTPTRFWLGTTIFARTNLDLELQELDVLSCFFKHRADIYLKNHGLTYVRIRTARYPSFFSVQKKNYCEFSFFISSQWYKLALVPLGTRFCNTFRRSLIRSLLFCITKSRKTSESSFRQQQASAWNYMQHHRGCRANSDLVTLA